jgi:exonuclease III
MTENDSKILNWNVRGLNSAARREAVKLMVHKARPYIICLQETKLDAIDGALAMEFMGQEFNCLDYLPAEETRGGILIACHQDYVLAGPVIKGKFSLSMLVTLKLTNSKFMLTTVYGPTNSADKSDFLDELRNSRPGGNMPWLCLGDFNLICEAQDKNNTNINRGLMRRFRQALDASELMEIKLQNRKYTWSNGRRNPTLVKLDRVFCNHEWDNLLPDMGLMALSSSLSDHCPLFLCNQQQPYRRATFKFESFWTRVPDFLQTVQNDWLVPARGSNPLMILHNRLQGTALALRSWSKSLFSQAQLQMEMANEVIMKLDIAQET